jgi:hypothetical protein
VPPSQTKQLCEVNRSDCHGDGGWGEGEGVWVPGQLNWLARHARHEKGQQGGVVTACKKTPEVE